MAAALGKVRAGHASGGMLDAVQVPMDGSEVPLAAVAQVMVKDPQTLLLTVYDPAMVRTPQPRPVGGWCRRATEGTAAPQASAVDRAIREAGLGLSPALDGSKLRVGLPRCAPDVRAGHPHKGLTPRRSMTDAYRSTLVKQAKEALERGKGQVRRVRTDAIKSIRAADGIGKDDLRRMETWAEEMAAHTTVRLEAAFKAKEAELRTV